MAKKYDFLIVGAGLFGSTFARHATDSGKKVLVIDKRDHIAGNCYDKEIEGIHVGLYGPHFLHCPDESTWKFVNRFSDFNNVRAKPKVNYKNSIYSFPINLMTLSQVWGVTSPEEAKNRIELEKVPIENPSNFEEFILSKVGRKIYEMFFEGYTTKQWGRHPSKLPSSIAKRIPIRLTYDDNYFPDSHIYQGIPVNGYTNMFKKMLEGIEVELEVDYLKNRNKLDEFAEKVLYTGPLDALYDYKFGKLEYRSLRFETERVMGDFQGNTVINYTDVNVPFTRITEWKHKYNIECEHSYITREYPDSYENTGEAYYPINDTINNELHQKYQKLADSSGMLTGGRNADYRYYDMNMVIPAATRLAEKAMNVGKHAFDC
jgi:UDP-galactopyranose mutase